MLLVDFGSNAQNDIPYLKLGQTEKFTVGLTDHEPSEVGDLPLNGRLDFRFQGLGFNFLFRGQWDRLHVVSPSGLPPKPSWHRLLSKITTNYSAAYPAANRGDIAACNQFQGSIQ